MKGENALPFAGERDFILLSAVKRKNWGGSFPWLGTKVGKRGAFSGGRVWAHAATSKDALRPLQARRFHGKGSGLLGMDTPTIGGLQVCCEAETILFIILS